MNVPHFSKDDSIKKIGTEEFYKGERLPAKNYTVLKKPINGNADHAAPLDVPLASAHKPPTTPTPPPASPDSLPPAELPEGIKSYTDIVVAVHGIGDQSRFATLRSVTARMASSPTLRKTMSSEASVSPVVPQPLGYFHGNIDDIASIRLLDDADNLKDSDLEGIGFAEVFWADIPQSVLDEGRTLEEIKSWARSVVARADYICEHGKNQTADASKRKPDFQLAAEVLDEIIDTVYVLENLFLIADKAGVFKFDLREVLDKYLGDVQLVTEYSYHRTDVVGRFQAAMADIHQRCPQARIHIIAHSEGTVVSFLGILHALYGQELCPATAQSNAKLNQAETVPSWLRKVHGFMTIGSPIDKHLLLWPRLWEPFKRKLTPPFPVQIHWRNYYDYGDPVGFKLDTARLWLKDKELDCFQFEEKHDFGFARYLMPGAAHNEYWNDPKVFEHFIVDVVKDRTANPTNTADKHIPKSKPLIVALSPTIPYVLSFLVLMLGVFIIFKAVRAFTHPSLDPLQKFVRFQELGVVSHDDLGGLSIFSAVLGIAGLIGGATLLARFPRLAVGKFWKAMGFIAMLVGFCFYAGLVPISIRNEIGARFWYLARHLGSLAPWAPTFGILGVTAVAAMTGYLALVKFDCRQKGQRWQKLKSLVGGTDCVHSDRQQRWLLRGMRPLIVCGAIAIGLIILSQLYPQDIKRIRVGDQFVPLSPIEASLVHDARLSESELRQIISVNPTNWVAAVKNVEPVLATNSSVWPVALAGAAFLYLWWLATLLFDLAFVWQRYVRRSTTNDRLRYWIYGSPSPEKNNSSEAKPAEGTS